MEDRVQLGDGDRRRFDGLLSLQMRGNALMFELNQDGFETNFLTGMRWLVRKPGVQQWWEVYSEIYKSDFRD